MPERRSLAEPAAVGRGMAAKVDAEVLAEGLVVAAVLAAEAGGYEGQRSAPQHAAAVLGAASQNRQSRRGRR